MIKSSMTNSRLLSFGNGVRVDLYQDVFHMLSFIISLPLYCLPGICTKDNRVQTWLTCNQSKKLYVENSLQVGTGSINKTLEIVKEKVDKNMVALARTITSYCLKIILFSFPIWKLLKKHLTKYSSEMYLLKCLAYFFIFFKLFCLINIQVIAQVFCTYLFLKWFDFLVRT